MYGIYVPTFTTKNQPNVGHVFLNFHPKNWGRWTQFDTHNYFFRWLVHQPPQPDSPLFTSKAGAAAAPWSTLQLGEPNIMGNKCGLSTLKHLLGCAGISAPTCKDWVVLHHCALKSAALLSWAGNLRCVVDGTSSWLRTCSILGGESLRGWKIGRWKNLTSFNSVQMRYLIYPQIRRNRLRLANEHGAQEPKMWKPELHLSFRSEFKDRSKAARLIQQKWKHLVFRILQKVGVCDIPAPTKIQQHQILPLALQPHLVWWFGFPLADLGVFGRILAKAGPSGRRILPPFFGGGSNKAKMFVLGIFPE